MRLLVYFSALVFFSQVFGDYHTPILSERQLALLKEYRLDEAYLAEFPFDLYIPRTVPGRGIFYNDQIYDGMKMSIRDGEFEGEPANTRAMLKYIVPNTIVLDIGAHIGTHTVTMSKAVHNGLVIAFEPQKKICRELTMNVLANSCRNVITVHCALGDQNKLAYLGEPVYGNEGARFISNHHFCEAVEMRTLDSFELNGISFIKIDTENFEKEVLLGARETLARNKPILLVEIQGNQVKAQEDGVDMQLKMQESIALLQSLGYIVTNYSCFDFLAIPASVFNQFKGLYQP